jgi:tetratricopeptide (TPR) repeat protein
MALGLLALGSLPGRPGLLQQDPDPARLERAVAALIGAPAQVRRGEAWAARARRLAIACDRAGRMELSLRTWEVLAEARERAPWTLLNLAIACRHAGHYPRADRLLQEAAAGGGDPAFWFNERALVWKGAGRRDRALELLRRGVERGGPGAGNARLNLGLLLLDRGLGEEAARVLQPAPRDPPGTLAALLYLRHGFCHGRPHL